MSDLDPDIANGTCYYAPFKAAGDELVPCGNGGIDTVACCFGGDYCDAQYSCYDDDTGNTYLAGCTDSQYTDTACPWKSPDFEDQEWVGLIRCDATDAEQAANEYPWMGCAVPASAYTSLERLPGTCGCDGKTALFSGQQALTRHASLPESVGSTISWVEAYTVTAFAASAMETSPNPASTSAISTQMATATESASSSSTTAVGTSGGGLSAGNKATIAGSVVGGLLVLAIIALMVFLHKRRQGPWTGTEKGTGTGGTTVVNVNENPPPAYSDWRPSELEAIAPKFAARATELAADDSNSGSTTPNRPVTRSPVGITPEMAPSEFGNAYRHSLVSDMSHNDEHGGLFISSAPATPPMHRMQSISELPG
ncbi:unnamed protein product [Discula destructiva]